MQVGKRMVLQEIISLKNRIRAVWLIVSLLFALALCPQAFADSVSYTYDSLNRLTSIIYGNGQQITYTYDAAGNRTAYTVAGAESGTIHVNPEPADMNAAAPWTLTGPGSYSQTGTWDQTLTSLTPGDYTLTWGDVFGWTKPSPPAPTQTLAADGTITFTGTYTQIPQTGTVVINPEPAAMNTTAPWILAGPNSKSGMGDQTLSNSPIGDYMIIWGDVSGWIKPSPAT